MCGSMRYCSPILVELLRNKDWTQIAEGRSNRSTCVIYTFLKHHAEDNNVL